MIYTIPNKRVNKLITKLSHIKRKCEKYGISFAFEKINETVEKTKGGKIIPCTRYEISGKAIVNGWKLLGEVKSTNGGNLLFSFDGADIEEYRCKTPFCEHCKTKRDRVYSFVVENEKGERKQVGKSCLKEYTNGLDAELSASLCDLQAYLWELENPQESFEGEFGEYEDKYAYMETFVAQCYDAVLNCGYDINKFASDVEKGTPSDVALAGVKPYIEWVMASKEDGQFISNLKRILGCGYVEKKYVNCIGASINRYLREKARKEAEGSVVNEWLAEEGERVVVSVEVTPTNVKHIYTKRSMHSNGYCFDTPVYCLIDTKGHSLIWNVNNDTVGMLNFDNMGKTLTFKATVQKNSEYKGVRQSRVVRLALL